MPPAPLPAHEAERLAALRSYDVLDSACEESFDGLTRLAARITGSPIALVSLIDADRQWFKSHIGLAASETPRDQSFCAHAIVTPDQPLLVPDATRDPRFADNPAVTGAFGLRFYAGLPLVNSDGHALGTLCVADTTPRDLPQDDVETLSVLAHAVMATLELRRTMASLRNQTLTDGLTGLPNRPAFLRALAQAIARQRRDARPFTVIYLDLDGFKQVNDLHGHAVGDEALTHVATALRANIRPSDSAARLGGDEFAALLVGGDGTEAALVAERLRAGIAADMAAEGWPVTASLGAVTFLNPPRDEMVALSIADMHMYAAKHAGRNRVVSHDQISLRPEPDQSAVAPN